MTDSCIRLSLDLQQTNMNITVRAKRGDTGRVLRIALADDGVPYTVGEDCYAVFTGKKPDKTVLYSRCSLENNEILYTFTEQTCAVAGRIPAEIRLYGSGGGDQLSCWRCMILCTIRRTCCPRMRRMPWMRWYCSCYS